MRSRATIGVMVLVLSCGDDRPSGSVGREAGDAAWVQAPRSFSEETWPGRWRLRHAWGLCPGQYIGPRPPGAREGAGPIDYRRSQSLPEEDDVEAKEAVRALLDRLPDDCSVEDVLYHLYVLQAIEHGQAEAGAGRTIPHEEVDHALRWKWLGGREA